MYRIYIMGVYEEALEQEQQHKKKTSIKRSSSLKAFEKTLKVHKTEINQKCFSQPCEWLIDWFKVETKSYTEIKQQQQKKTPFDFIYFRAAVDRKVQRVGL